MCRVLALATVLLVLAVNGLLPIAAKDASPPAGPQASPAAATFPLYEAVLAERRGEVDAATAGRLSVYTIEATFTLAPAVPVATGAGATPVMASPAAGGEGTAAVSAATLAGRLDLRYVNGTGAEVSEIYFRLYPNAEGYAEGEIVVSDVTVDGAPSTPERGVDDTVLRVPLSTPVPSGRAANVTMAFTTDVPTQTGEALDLFSFDPAGGTFALAYWYPLLAGYDPESGWHRDPLSELGDPLFADSALYDVTLTTPPDLVVVASGVELAAETRDGQTRHRFVTGPARDFTVVADDDFASVSRNVGGTTVTSYYNPELAEAGAAVLEYGAQALAVYNDLFGAYPYAELDLVGVTMPNWGGFEFSELVFIENGSYQNLATEYPPGSLEFTVAHEVAHQWWYNLVGSNQQTHAFLDEGLTEYTAIVYVERQHGPAAAERWFDLSVEVGLSFRIAAVGDGVADRSSSAFTDDRDYTNMVYRKGAAGFRALRREIGDAAYFAGLRDYATQTRFTVAVPATLRGAFERASGRDLGPFWRGWFEDARTRASVTVETPLGTPAVGTPTP